MNVDTFFQEIWAMESQVEGTLKGLYHASIQMEGPIKRKWWKVQKGENEVVR